MFINAECLNAGERERDDLQYLELNHQKQCEVYIYVTLPESDTTCASVKCNIV